MRIMLFFVLLTILIEISTQKDKTILLFTKFFEKNDWGVGEGKDPFMLSNCSIRDCHVTWDQTHLSSLGQFDALLFHARNMPWFKFNLPPASERRPEQVYVFFSHESPVNDGLSFEGYDNFFNWTMSYRIDSDIYVPYGYMHPRYKVHNYTPPYPLDWLDPTSLQIKNHQNESYEPRRLVSWVVSRCNPPSKRSRYVEKLRRYIDIDQFGGCNSNQCDDQCYEKVFTGYKFFLALENSDCTDYITEKFWRSMEKGIVPIVKGSGNYSMVAPPHSFIDTKDFSSAEDLANYLIYLDQNIEEYKKYFWWREHYTVKTDLLLSQGLCNLCKKLWNLDAQGNTSETPPRKDIGEWWNYQQCTLPAENGFLYKQYVLLVLLNDYYPTLIYLLIGLLLSATIINMLFLRKVHLCWGRATRKRAFRILFECWSM